MKLNQLIEKNLVNKIEENSYQCLICNKSFTKLGVGNHYFYEHDEDGKLAKDKLREIAKKQNNDPEMRKKISENTKKAFENPEVKEALLKGNRTEKHKNAVQNFIKMFKEAGYNVKLYQANAADYGVPQDRKRIFYIEKLYNI